MKDEFVTLKEHLEMKIALNDRRYTEVNIEKEKALKIKEEADKVALGLAREIQTYKDESNNRLREQINSERGLYATKLELTAAIEKVEVLVKPLITYVTTQQGRSGGLSQWYGWIIAGIGAILGLIAYFK
jgi:hypothetical protein